MSIVHRNTQVRSKDSQVKTQLVLWIFIPYLYTSNTTGMNHLKIEILVCYRTNSKEKANTFYGQSSQFLLLTLAARATGSFCPADHQLVFKEIFCTTLDVDSLVN